MNARIQRNLPFVGVVAGFCLLAILLFLPFIASDPIFLSVIISTFLFAAAALGWNMFSGFTGYISLGHATFYGLGAYALAIVCQYWHVHAGLAPFLLLPVIGILVGALALPLGWVALRTRRHTFTIMTIAMFFIVQYLSYNLRGLTNGSSGLTLPIPNWNADAFNRPFYFVALLLLALALSSSCWLYSSSWGLQLRAIRDDEDRALGLGVRANGAKLCAFVLSAAFVGMVGALGAYFLGYVSPESAFDRSFNIAVVLFAALGGFTVPTGPVVGALLAVPLQQYLTIQYGTSGFSLLLYGGLLLAVLLWLPEGVIPALRSRWFAASQQAELELTVHEAPVVPQSNAQLPTTPLPVGSIDFDKALVHLNAGKLRSVSTIPSRYHGPTFVVHKTVTTKVKAQRLRPLKSEVPVSEVMER